MRRLSVDDAVQLALEQNLGIQVERFNPQIQDMRIAQTRSLVGADADSRPHQQLDRQPGRRTSFCRRPERR